MHQTRQEVVSKIPLPRRGTKYVARAASHHREAVPVIIAVRDMLKLAKTTREVREMIKQNLLKLNGRLVRDVHESIKLFNILEADKLYSLTLSPTGKFMFDEAKEKGVRLVKVVNKHLVKGRAIQLNMHDGTNIITKEPIALGDSLYLTFENKVKRHVSLEKGKHVAIIQGKYIGAKGTIADIQGRKVKVSVNGGTTHIDAQSVVAL